MAAPSSKRATFADLLALPEHVRAEVIVHRWQPAGYLVALTAAAGDVVRAEPFDAVELRVATLFGLEDDEE